MAGAVAKLALKSLGINIYAYTSQVGNIALNKDYTELDLNLTELNAVRCPDTETAIKMESLIKEVQKDGDTIGGIITCVIKGTPAGLGEPVFGKLHSALGSAMLGINAAKVFEYGKGLEGCFLRGSQVKDIFYNDNGKIKTKENNSGGIQGGISNGEDIYFKVGFKPVATLLKDIPTVNKDGEEVILKAKGRHDPCVLPRAVPIVEAMAAMVILDFYLLNKSTHL